MTRGPSSSHPFAVVFLLALAALRGALAIAAIWANQRLLDTRGWVAASERMLEDGEVRRRVAVFLAGELVDEAERRLAAAGEEGLAAEVVPQLRRRGPQLARQVMATPSFRVVWVRANRQAHRALLRAIDEDGRAQRAVVIDLTPSLRELATAVGRTELAESLEAPDLAALVEPGAARIEVLEAEELERARDAVRGVRALPAPATVATLVLLALALLLGRARLSRTVLGVGLSLAAAGALALLARARGGDDLVAALVSDPADREAAEAAWRIATDSGSELAVGAICLGGLIALFGLLAGPSATAVGLRRGLAPLLRSPLGVGLALLVAALVFLLLLAWAPIAALEAPLGALLFAAVAGGGLLALARVALAEERAAAAWSGR